MKLFCGNRLRVLTFNYFRKKSSIIDLTDLLLNITQSVVHKSLKLLQKNPVRAPVHGNLSRLPMQNEKSTLIFLRHFTMPQEILCRPYSEAFYYLKTLLMALLMI